MEILDRIPEFLGQNRWSARVLHTGATLARSQVARFSKRSRSPRKARRPLVRGKLEAFQSFFAQADSLDLRFPDSGIL
jgi:hypothetical protein